MVDKWWGTASELDSRFQLNSTQVARWKRQLVDQAASIFENGVTTDGELQSVIGRFKTSHQGRMGSLGLGQWRQRQRSPCEAMRG